jgi:hypothetical protein
MVSGHITKSIVVLMQLRGRSCESKFLPEPRCCLHVISLFGLSVSRQRLAAAQPIGNLVHS